MKAAERAALQDVLDQIERLRAYGVVRMGVALELLNPAGGPPIPMGWIDDEGRLSIDAIAANVPIGIAQRYARDLAELLGATTAGPHQIMLIDADGNRPSIAPLLQNHAAGWIRLLERHAALIRCGHTAASAR
ncbi:MAG: hypothetical protein KAY22_16340 [Rhizorhabdus sp.]|uniref:hypothetical protein n=1 Tax=Rhizorhabdus sp. TaxID=1968843 RepID=UPI001B61D36A|nr:hypothetical protein [Rhizorhabdus sp.]MBP8233870.1 hypothetical protein [Rhizorhabdus sp.]